jgi:hypothetical protein
VRGLSLRDLILFHRLKKISMNSEYSHFAKSVRKIIHDSLGMDLDSSAIDYGAQIILNGNMAEEYEDAIYFRPFPFIKIQDSFLVEKMKYDIISGGLPDVEGNVLKSGLMQVSINNQIIIRRSLLEFMGVPFRIEPNIILVGSRNNHITVYTEKKYNWTHCRNFVTQVTLYGALIKNSTVVS